MKEQGIQKKILDFLEAQGFVTCKVIVANKAGVLDIIGCDKIGRYWEIEVKKPDGSTSKLQEVRLKKLLKNQAKSFVAYSYEDFLQKFYNRTVI